MYSYTININKIYNNKIIAIKQHYMLKFEGGDIFMEEQSYILENINSQVDKVKVRETGRIAYVRNNSYK